MGKLTTTGADLAGTVNTGTLTSATSTAWFPFLGRMQLALWNTFSASIRAEISFDGGTTAIPLTYMGDAVIFSAPAAEVLECVEEGLLIRLTCISFTSGTCSWRLSR